MRWNQRFSTIGIMAVLAACSTEPNGSDPLVTLDAAMVAAEAAAQDVEVMRGPAGRFGFGLRVDPGSFNCEPVGRDNLSITRTCTYKDEDGNVQTAYDPDKTASVTVRTEIVGTIERPALSATMERTTDLTVSGLAGAETSMIWNGSAAGSLNRVRTSQEGETREYDMSHSGTITNVVIPVPRTENGWPLSGTITREMNVTFTGGPRDGQSVQRTVTIEFNGTQTATVTVNGETFEFDLSQRGRPHRRRP